MSLQIPVCEYSFRTMGVPHLQQCFHQLAGEEVDLHYRHHFIQIVFMWSVSAIILTMKIKERAQKHSRTHIYIWRVWYVLGHFYCCCIALWSIIWFGALTAAVLSAVVLGLFCRANKTEAANCLGVYPLEGALFTVAVEIPTRGHLHNDGRTLVAAPSIFKYPATLLCCGRKRWAQCFVPTMVLWVDLVALQLGLLQTVINAFTISAAPFAIITNVMLVVLALFCLANIFSLLFTISAHL